DLEILLVEDEFGGGLVGEVLGEAAELRRERLVAAEEDADALPLVVHGDALEHVAPARAREVGAHPRPGHHVHAVLGVVERLEHRHQRRPRVPLLVHAGAVVVELDQLAPGVAVGHLVHHAAEPLERALLPRAPVEVDALRHERPPRRGRGAAAIGGVRRGGGLGVVVDVVEDVLDDADERGGADA
ncbi:Os12g0541350, partial [Oryza sativa Japonica Group]